MTLVLDVPPVLEATLQANAQARGVTVEQYVLALMEREISTPAPPSGSKNWTLQDALDYAGPPPDDLARAALSPAKPSSKGYGTTRRTPPHGSLPKR